MNVYVGDDDKLHFVDSAGADTVLKKMGNEPTVSSEIDVESDLNIKWHNSGEYNIGTGYKNAYLIFTRLRTSLNDTDIKIIQSYDSVTGKISYSFFINQNDTYIQISCRLVKFIAIAY